MPEEPAIVRQATAVRDVLSARATELEDQAHNIEMALLDLRIARTKEDRAAALLDLRDEVAKSAKPLFAGRGN